MYAIMVLDVKTAFLYGSAVRELFVELPEADEHYGDPTKIGRLVKSLYGTRDAPQRWALEVGECLRAAGFRECVNMPSVFTHDERDIAICLHVDDFLCTGLESDLLWLRSILEERYELKSEILGPANHHVRTAKYLKRTITYEDDGLVVETDPRHVVELVRTLGLEQCRTLNSPILPETVKNELKGVSDKQKQPLQGAMTRAFRKAVALTV